MKKISLILLSFFLTTQVVISQSKLNKVKSEIVSSVEKHSENLINISNQIWELAETAFNEHESSKILSDYAEKNGFSVERGVAGMPTAFIATYGEGEPVIGVVGEFDALPGLSQQAKPVKSPFLEGAAGHGCGHNMFGSGSLGAAIAIKEMIEQG